MVGGLLVLACGGDPEPVVAPPPEPVAEPAPVVPPFEPGERLAAAVAKAPAGLEASNPSVADPSAVSAGESVYGEHCVACHGIRGDGDGAAAAALPQRPSDFTDAGRWAYTSFGQKKWLLEKGIPGTPHAPSALADETLTNVLAYVESTFSRG